MIGHYLLTLTPKQEKWVLTRKMEPGAYFSWSKLGPCLVGVVCGEDTEKLYAHGRRYLRYDNSSIEAAYDRLCHRFDAGRVNAAIRTRILANQARRTLTPMRETASV